MDEETLEKLSAPFPPEKISWRIGPTYDGQGQPLAYLTARDVMQRLDDVMGPENWSDSYEETPKRLLCTLELKLGANEDAENQVRSWDAWISKTDGAGDSQMEGEKGGISDAFKRAAVKWGIGRYLYDIKAPWVQLEGPKKNRLPKNFDGSKYLPGVSAFTSKQLKTKYWKLVRDAASENDSGKARETWDELTQDQQQELWKELSSGIRSTFKDLLKSTGVSDE